VTGTVTGPTNVVISGNGLGDVTGVTITPADGLILGAISVAPDGRSVTVPVTVAANAPSTVREVRLAGPSQPYIAARPGAEQLLITLAPPQIESIEPIVAIVGSTAMTLTVRGRNLQGTQAVALTPATGISVSNSPSVNADGTLLTIALTVGQFAPTGPRVVTVTTPGGTSDAIASPANTFSVVNVIQAVHTPIAAAHVGVVVQEAAPPAAPQTAFASQLGVALGPVATGISSAIGIIGESVTLTISGFGTFFATFAMSSFDSSASAYMQSAPASAYRLSRRIASSTPWVPAASVREMMMKSGSRRASHAAFTFCTISSAGMTLLPAMCPQRLGHTWSSNMTAATPAFSNARVAK